MTENPGPPFLRRTVHRGAVAQARQPDQRLAVISPHTEESGRRRSGGGARGRRRRGRGGAARFRPRPVAAAEPADRMRKVEQLAAIYGGHIDEMADLITDEMGSPRSFSRLGQAAAAVSMIHLALAVARDFPWTERRQGVLGEVHLRRAPVGVVAAIVPWNVPQFLIMPKLIPALIAGCTVIVKPAPETPLDALWLAEMIEQLDLPEGVVSVLPGGTEVGEALVRHPGVDKVVVHRVERGRAPHRRAVRRAAQAGEPRTRRQVGGDHPRRRRHRQDGPGIEVREPDEQRAGLRRADPHPGQRAAPRRGRRRAGRQMSGLQVGDPTDPATDIGPLVAQRQQAPGSGLHPVRGRKRAPASSSAARTAPARPRLVRAADGVRRRHQRHAHRARGDLRPGADRDALPRRGRRRPHRQRQRLRPGRIGVDRRHRPRPRGRRSVRTGTYGINMYTLDFGAPFGGFKQSGIGREFGPEGLHEYVELQTLVCKGRCRRYKNPGRHEGSRPKPGEKPCLHINFAGLVVHGKRSFEHSRRTRGLGIRRQVGVEQLTPSGIEPIVSSHRASEVPGVH